MKEEIEELKKAIKYCEELIKDPKCELAEQTWLELQIIEYKKQLKSLRAKI